VTNETAAQPSPIARASFYLGVASLTAATLMLQLVMTRILSVIVWYHLAFFAISLAMFGMTAGAVWVYLRGARFSRASCPRDLADYCALFAAGAVLSLLAQVVLTGVTLAPMLIFSGWSFLAWTGLAVCMAVPFFFSGVAVSLALTRSGHPLPRVYGADMIGAALGCLGVLALLDRVDGVSGLFWTAALGGVAAVLFLRAGGASAAAVAPRPPLAFLLGRPAAITAAIALLAAWNTVSDQRIRPLVVKGVVQGQGAELLYERWNSFSRIAVYQQVSKEPHLWGASAALPRRRWAIDQRWMNVDGAAGTVMYQRPGDLSGVEFLKFDVTNLAYVLPERPRVGIVGVGGGRDVLSALAFGRRDVTGVELNPIFVDLLTRVPGFVEYAGLRDTPGLRLFADEARSWFARSEESFDLIQMSLIDTWAATGAGAFTLSENGLYTVEGWRVFLRRLSPRGVFTVSRWYAPGAVNETGRMISVTVAALMSMGATNPAEHVFLAASGQIATLIVSRDPLAPADVAELERTAAELRFAILLSPSGLRASPALARIVSARTPDELHRHTSTLELDLTPATDDRPFFFNQLPLHEPVQVVRRVLAGVYARSGTGVVTGNLYATATLLMLLAVALALVLATIVVPVRPALRDVGVRLVAGGSFYFLLTGVGFMALEIGLLQRMSVFLGHPIYSLSIVLFTLILSTGLGSLLSERLPLQDRGRFVAWALLTGGYAASLPLWLSDVLLAFDSAGLLARAAICVATIAPGGLLMGFAFPTGMRLVSAIDERPTPWFWGINGAAGVLSAILAIVSSMAYGIGFTLLVGAACYLLLIPSALAIGFPRGPRP
jgi:spermidine synthase